MNRLDARTTYRRCSSQISCFSPNITAINLAGHTICCAIVSHTPNTSFVKALLENGKGPLSDIGSSAQIRIVRGTESLAPRTSVPPKNNISAKNPKFRFAETDRMVCYAGVESGKARRCSVWQIEASSTNSCCPVS